MVKSIIGFTFVCGASSLHTICEDGDVMSALQHQSQVHQKWVPPPRVRPPITIPRPITICPVNEPHQCGEDGSPATRLSSKKDRNGCEIHEWGCPTPTINICPVNEPHQCGPDGSPATFLGSRKDRKGCEIHLFECPTPTITICPVNEPEQCGPDGSPATFLGSKTDRNGCEIHHWECPTPVNRRLEGEECEPTGKDMCPMAVCSDLVEGCTLVPGKFRTLPSGACCQEQCKTSCKTDSCVCTKESSPQCGEDGKTYANPCMAKCAGVEFTDGECCTNGETRGNPCSLETCNNGQWFLKSTDCPSQSQSDWCSDSKLVMHQAPDACCPICLAKSDRHKCKQQCKGKTTVSKGECRSACYRLHSV